MIAAAGQHLAERVAAHALDLPGASLAGSVHSQRAGGAEFGSSSCTPAETRTNDPGSGTMRMKEFFLAQLEREVPPTRRTIEQVPEGKNDWRPHPKSMPLGYLAVLVYGSAGAAFHPACQAGDSFASRFGRPPRLPGRVGSQLLRLAGAVRRPARRRRRSHPLGYGGRVPSRIPIPPARGSLEGSRGWRPQVVSLTLGPAAQGRRPMKRSGGGRAR
jgi:hypothetical protein